ncbi:MAG: TIGR04282 family arsenosugar biosynthesis glycosyltransferase [Pseudomonadota bacterium]
MIKRSSLKFSGITPRYYHSRPHYLVIMVKTPKAGAVKTRLSRDIGVARATSFYRHLCSGIIKRLSASTKWQTLLAVSPDLDVCHPFWNAVHTITQGRGDLGQRMQRVFNDLPPGPVVIIGTDIPEITLQHISDAFVKLGNHDVVLGPADDGGYWLVGQNRMPRVLSLFENVRWSSEFTLQDTLKNTANARVALLDILRDVDTAKDYYDLRYKASRCLLPFD